MLAGDATWALTGVCMKLTSAFLIFGTPVLVILAFCLMAWQDRRRTTGVRSLGFVERNGWPVAMFLVAAVAIWALVLVVLP